MQKNKIYRSFLQLFAVIVATSGLVLSANANERKTAIITFDAPGAVNGTEALAINPGGSIIGFYFDANFVPHGFLRAHNGSFMTFDAPGAGLQQGTYPTSINPGGSITGFYFDANSVPHGFLRAPNGSFTTFDLPVGSSLANVPPQPGSAISPDGSVAGTYLDASLVGHGFLRTPDGAFTTFGAPGTLLTSANSINPAGAITGYYVVFTSQPFPFTILFHGFLRSADGTITTFDAPDALYTFASGNSINPEGAISGNYNDASFVSHGFLRAADGTFTTFDVPGAGTGPFQGTGTFGVAINPALATAGTYTDAGGTTHGFLRAGDGTITAFDPQGSVFTFPASINPAGSITGFYLDASSVSHGFLRSP